MITLPATRQDLEAIRDYFLPFMELLQQTRLNNVAHASVQSDEYLSTMATNFLFREITDVVMKQVGKNKSGDQKIKLSDAQGIMFFRFLVLSFVPAEQFYLLKLRNDLILELDKQFIEQAFYQQPVHNPEKPSEEDDFDEEYPIE